MAIMVIHPSSLVRLTLFLPILIHSYQYSVSASPTCSADNAATFEDLHRIPVSSSSSTLSRRAGGDHGGKVVFDAVHVHHPKFLRIQSVRKVKNIAHTEGRSSLIQGSLKRGLLREEILNRATREERRMNSKSTTTYEGKYRRLVAEERDTVVAAGGEYMVEMQIGTPPTPVLLILDTGSGLSWIQCKQCVQCSPQKDPVFDPSASSSYRTLSCQSPSCLNSSSEFQCNTLNNTCEYGVQYGQSSFTTGIVSKDNLQVLNGSITVSDFLFGCGLFNMGDFVGSSGLLGLSRSNISFPSQLRMQHPTLGRKFTLCFADLAHNLSATGFIFFGNSSFNSSSTLSSAGSQNSTGPQNEIVYTPFAPTPFPTQFYYVGLNGISVDGKNLPINSSVFELDQAGDGGTVIDSGTTLTLLNPQAYGALRDAFRVAGAVRGRLPKVSSDGFNSTGHVIDTCYQFNDNQSSNWTAREMVAAVPSVALHFIGDVELILPPDNVLFPFDEGLYCLAFASTLSDLGINVIGNIQQQNFLMEYDLENSRVGLQSVTGCDRPIAICNMGWAGLV